MINNLTVLRTIKRGSPTFVVSHRLNRILKILFVFLIPSITLLVGSLVLAKPAELSQTNTAISKDTAGQNTIFSDISGNQTKIESVEVKSEVLPSAVNDENSEINQDNPKTDDVTEVSYRPDPIYDPVGAELERVIAGDTSVYVQNASADLAQLDPNRYTVDPLEQLAELNGDDSLLNQLDPTRQNNPTGQPQPTANYQPANQSVNTVQYHYNGDGHLVGKTVDGVRTDFALDIAGGLPEVIYTSEGNSYLHLPGMIMTENAAGDVRYLLMDGLGSVRQVVDEAGNVVASYEFDPYGNPVQTSGGDPYGYTGEWWENEVGLLHLRQRWYMPGTGTFLSRDPLESEPPYLYAGGNPINRIDPSGLCEQMGDDSCWGVYDLLVQEYPSLQSIMYYHAGDLVSLHQLPEFRLRSLLNEPPAGAVVQDSPSNVLGLMRLFEADHFPGQSAQARLDWILNTTNDGRYRHFALFPPGDSGFCTELGDQEFYDGIWNEVLGGKPSNQTGHFLTATSFGFSSRLPENFSLSVIVGHEMITDERAPYYPSQLRKVKQTLAATSVEREHFFNAVDYDKARQYDLRDSELEAILGFSEEPPINRVGNSLQDLRLTVKGWRFGREILNENIQTRQQAIEWLRKEVYDPNRVR